MITCARIENRVELLAVCLSRQRAETRWHEVDTSKTYHQPNTHHRTRYTHLIEAPTNALTQVSAT
jgi:hypothetical protein